MVVVFGASAMSDDADVVPAAITAAGGTFIKDPIVELETGSTTSASAHVAMASFVFTHTLIPHKQAQIHTIQIPEVEKRIYTTGSPTQYKQKIKLKKTPSKWHIS